MKKTISVRAGKKKKRNKEKKRKRKKNWMLKDIQIPNISYQLPENTKKLQLCHSCWKKKKRGGGSK